MTRSAGLTAGSDPWAAAPWMRPRRLRPRSEQTARGPVPSPSVRRCRSRRQVPFAPRTRIPCRNRLPSDPPEQAGDCRPVAYEAPAAPRPPRTVLPLEIPSAIPGSAAPPLRLPPVRPGTTPAKRRSEIEALFADLEVIPPATEPVPVPGQAR